MYTNVESGFSKAKYTIKIKANKTYSILIKQTIVLVLDNFIQTI